MANRIQTRSSMSFFQQRPGSLQLSRQDSDDNSNIDAMIASSSTLSRSSCSTAYRIDLEERLPGRSRTAAGLVTEYGNETFSGIPNQVPIPSTPYAQGLDQPVVSRTDRSKLKVGQIISLNRRMNVKTQPSMQISN